MYIIQYMDVLKHIRNKRVNMSGKMSKNKGSNYERATAKAFSQWGGKEFYRTPASGAWSSQRQGQNAQVGDIVAPEDIIFPFSIELKHHENVTLDNYMFSNGEVPSFFSQNVGDAIRANKIPMLITHSNYAPNYMSLPYSSKFITPFKEKEIPYLVTTVKFKDYVTEEPIVMDITIVTLEDFFSVYKLEDFSKGYKTMFRYWYKEISPNIVSRVTGRTTDIDEILKNL